MTASRIVVALASSLLVFAGAAKHYTFFSRPFTRDSIFNSREMLLWFGIAEITIGLICLCWNARKFAWSLQVGCYATFIILVINSQDVFVVPSSCGCIGALPISPVTMGFLDLGILMSLLTWMPFRWATGSNAT
jgi:hypothetical protein